MTNLKSKAAFVSACRKRSVFSDDELEKHWDRSPNNRPFIVNFLYVHSLPKRPNLMHLKDTGVITDAPRGFKQLSSRSFDKLLEISHANQHLIID